MLYAHVLHRRGAPGIHVRRAAILRCLAVVPLVEVHHDAALAVLEGDALRARIAPHEIWLARLHGKPHLRAERIARHRHPAQNLDAVLRAVHETVGSRPVPVSGARRLPARDRLLVKVDPIKLLKAYVRGIFEVKELALGRTVPVAAYHVAVAEIQIRADVDGRLPVVTPDRIHEVRKRAPAYLRTLAQKTELLIRLPEPVVHHVLTASVLDRITVPLERHAARRDPARLPGRDSTCRASQSLNEFGLVRFLRGRTS